MNERQPFSCKLEERWIPPKEWKKADWDEFVTEHTRLILGVCKKRLHDEQLAEDAMQDTFTKLFNDAYKFKYGGYEQFCAWAVKTAERKCFNLLRQQKAIRRMESNYCAESETMDSLIPETDSRLGDKIDFERVEGQIPEIVRLKHLEGLSHKEIAEKLGITEQSAKSMLSIAMKELREQLNTH